MRRLIRQLSPGARFAKALELSADSRRLFAQGLRERFPSLGDDALGPRGGGGAGTAVTERPLATLVETVTP